MSKAFLQHISQKVGAGLDYELSSDGNSYTIVGSSNCTAVSLSIPSMFRGKPVAEIASGAFLNKTNLKRVFIPDSIMKIGEQAFGGCSNLEHMTIPTCDIQNYFYSLPFGYIFGETEYEGGERTEQYYDSGVSGGRRWYTSYIPKSLTSIVYTGNIVSYGMFDSCENLKNVHLPNAESLYQYALSDCKGLEHLELSNNLTGIDSGALSGIGVKSLIIPDSVTSIGFSTFGNTSPLKYFFYRGTAAQWSRVTIDVGNNCITSDIIYYFSETQPTTGGRYWHYVDGVPTVW